LLASSAAAFLYILNYALPLSGRYLTRRAEESFILCPLLLWPGKGYVYLNIFLFLLMIALVMVMSNSITVPKTAMRPK
jgi:hypothetical protein